MHRKILKTMTQLCALAVLMMALLPTAVWAQQVPAQDISGRELVTAHSGIGSTRMLFDGITIESLTLKDGAAITMTHEEGIGSLYLIFGTEYGVFSVTDEETGETVSFGENGFLHEFADLEATFGEAPKQVTLSFANGGGKLNELYAFTSGQVPEFVQDWSAPADGNADLVLFSTHADDEQLFFAGMLPWYAVEKDYRVQVVYLTGHRNMSMRRSHEMLDGLWAVGIRHYPVFGEYGDYLSGSLAEAWQIYRNKGYSREEILSYVVENIRRFRPKVAVGHDLNGEYGHGMHMLYADLLCEAVEISADGTVFPESAQKYGIWNIPKTYLHLYPENAIRMNWDIPMAHFGGLTPFEVTKNLGFPCHISQQTYYSWYFSGMESAAEITEYSPCEFGLFRSTVGEDQEKNDFFENVTTHAEDAAQALAREEAQKETQAVTEPTEQTIPAVEPTVPAPIPEETSEKQPAVALLAAGMAIALLGIAALITKAMGPGRRK